MLEYSRLSYWLTMRFFPGAINRWRAGEHVSFLRQAGFEVLCAERETRDALPGPKSRLARQFRSMDDAELRTTAIDVVARRTEWRRLDKTNAVCEGKAGLRMTHEHRSDGMGPVAS